MSITESIIAQALESGSLTIQLRFPRYGPTGEAARRCREQVPPESCPRKSRGPHQCITPGDWPCHAHETVGAPSRINLCAKRYAFSISFGQTNFSGFCLCDDPSAHVREQFVCQDASDFTLYHELAHLLFHTSGIVTAGVTWNVWQNYLVVDATVRGWSERRMETPRPGRDR
jgi:hypothetical protein